MAFNSWHFRVFDASNVRTPIRTTRRHLGCVDYTVLGLFDVGIALCDLVRRLGYRICPRHVSDRKSFTNIGWTDILDHLSYGSTINERFDFDHVLLAQ